MNPMMPHPKPKPFLIRFELGLSLLAIGLSACFSRYISPEEVGPVRLLDRLPSGISCQSLEQVRLREGTGCSNMGRTKPAQPEILYYNLRQQAQRRQANVVILMGPPSEDSWEGCPSNGLVVEAKLYRCAFASETAAKQ